MRNIELNRIGEYLKTAVDIIAEHNNEYPTRLLVSEMEKRLKPQDYELSKSKSGGVRWVTKFRFWTIGLVKGGYIKKHQKVWYLTDKGKSLVGKPADQFWRISKQTYEEWRDGERQEESEALITP